MRAAEPEEALRKLRAHHAGAPAEIARAAQSFS